MDDDARRLGERLLGEVESEGLSELFASLRELSLPPNHIPSIFGIPKLDALLSQPQQHRLPPPNPAPPTSSPHHHQPGQEINPQPSSPPRHPTSTTQPHPLTIDLISPPYSTHPSGSGKSTLTSLLIIYAILPQSLLGVPLNGTASTIILFDPLSRFHTPRLTQFLLHHLTTVLSSHNHSPNAPHVRKEILQCIRTALSRVLIFRPAGWTALLATLTSLSSSLLATNDSQRVLLSSNSKIHAVIFEDVHAFTPHIRAASIPSVSANPSPLALLAPYIRTLHETLRPEVVVLTSLSPTPISSIQHGGAVGASVSGVAVTRVAVRRVEVTRFAPGVSVEEAEGERGMRWEVVKRGRFEVWRVGGSGAAGEVVRFRIEGTGNVWFEGDDGVTNG
ncbi:unnamed protein product [Periconia digitata]|uniref:DNA recombination and repair protein Rad51-like C-terminal domain-containing protein n=1 Tax=Periconia digitata TaxID=1303443 RepID=A0A9W4UDG7_9PLEO|nr:unnamed protein product [Periconia digitata]